MAFGPPQVVCKGFPNFTILKGFQTHVVCWKRFGNGSLAKHWKRFGNPSKCLVNGSETLWKRFGNPTTMCIWKRFGNGVSKTRVVKSLETVWNPPWGFQMPLRLYHYYIINTNIGTIIILIIITIIPFILSSILRFFPSSFHRFFPSSPRLLVSNPRRI